MSIQMIGIDHNKAHLDERALFSFTVKARGEALEKLKETEGVNGAVILSTCNRMELWLSCADHLSVSPYSLLCCLKGVEKEKYRHLFTERKDEEAVNHLFAMTCGLKSLIIGEDQILTQVKEALDLAREYFAADQVLEVLFRLSITSAKKVKTNIPLSTANTSAIDQAILYLKQIGCAFHGEQCMVIGNGEMGKLAALALKAEGADVTVTVRQFRSGIVTIPEGCERIPYSERLEFLKQCSIIVSATASPNLTLEYEALAPFLMQCKERKFIFIDLAVPRDIDQRIADIPNVSLYDIDYFQIDPQSEQLKQQIIQVEQILKEQKEEFYSWYYCRDVIPKLSELSVCSAEDVCLRLHKIIQKMQLGTDAERKLNESILLAAEKVIKKLMFEIRDSLGIETFRSCTMALLDLYQEKGQVR